MLSILFCCHGRSWRSLVCLLDNVLHAVHLRSRRVCDWHDRLIAGDPSDWVEAGTRDERLVKFKALGPQPTVGPPWFSVSFDEPSTSTSGGTFTVTFIGGSS